MEYYIKFGDRFTPLADVVRYTNDHLIVENTAMNRYIMHHIGTTLEMLTITKEDNSSNFRRVFVLSKEFGNAKTNFHIELTLGADV